MQLTRCAPRHGIMRRQSDFSRLFDDFLAPFSVNGNGIEVNGMTPSVDIYEHDEKIVLNAELPGLKKEDITVDLKGKTLTLKGERKTEEEVKEENSYRRERHYGKFERSFRLGFEVDPETVEAKYENGVLKLTIPKPQEQKNKQIAIH